MVSTVTGSVDWWDLPDGGEKKMLEIMPRFVRNVEVDAFSVVGDLEPIRERELYKRVGFESFGDYMAHLGKDNDWLSKVQALVEQAKSSGADHVRIGILAEDTTQQIKADKLGLSQRHVSRLLDVITSTPEKRKSESNRISSRQLYLPQDVSRAAQKIRDKFGDEFAAKLKELL